MIPTREDWPGRICWLASAIAGAWRWQNPAEREDAAIALGLSYLAFAKRRSEMPPEDVLLLDFYPDLLQDIAQTLNTKANKRICRRLGLAYNPYYHQKPQPNDLPF